MSSRIEIGEESGIWPPLKGDALMVSESVTAQGGDTLEFKWKIPNGAPATRFAAIFVKLDEA